jgi:thioester reductase-like protein
MAMSLDEQPGLVASSTTSSPDTHEIVKRDIRPEAESDGPDRGSRGDALLLTGATGFVGMAVLARVLERTDRHVVVLVRATSQPEADARLDAVLASVSDSPGRHRGRVTAVCGDLTAPGLGLGTNRAWVSEQVSEIIHGAASVAFELSLPESRAINREGTRRVLTLAHECAVRGQGLRRLTYVSTAYVAGDRRGCAQESELNVGQCFRNAYEQSKHEAEQLVRSQRDRLPITVVRPSIVVGERGTGWTSSFNVMYGPLRALAAGALPLMPGRPGAVVDVVTVDHVAEAILALTASPEAAGGTFHIVGGEHATTVGEVARLGSQRFHKRMPRIVPLRIYRSILYPLMRRRADPTMRRRLERTKAYFPYMSLDLRFDDRRARELLEPLGIRAAPISEFFDELMDFAEAARWGRNPIARAHAFRPIRLATPRTAEPVAQ